MQLDNTSKIASPDFVILITNIGILPNQTNSRKEKIDLDQMYPPKNYFNIN